jgi:3-hydroxyisobutyrate dehydrogenase
MSAGFIGLGMMGDPMACNLLKAGHALSVFDIRPEAVEQCRALGATGVGSVPELVHCDPVFIMVNTAGQLNDVLFGESGLIGAMGKGQPQTIVVMSTISPNEIRSSLQQVLTIVKSSLGVTDKLKARLNNPPNGSDSTS